MTIGTQHLIEETRARLSVTEMVGVLPAKGWSPSPDCRMLSLEAAATMAREMGRLDERPAKGVDSKVHPKGRYERRRVRASEKGREGGEGERVTGRRVEERESTRENLRPPVNSYRTSYHARALARTRVSVRVHRHTRAFTRVTAARDVYSFGKFSLASSMATASSKEAQ